MRLTKLPIFLFFLFIMSFIFAISLAQDTPNQFSGTLNNENPFVEIGFSIPLATTITIDLNATSGDLDAYLYLVDSAGKIIAENDDRVRGDTNSSIGQIFVPAGDYTVIATRYNVTRGDSTGEYDLIITTDAQTRERLVYDVSAEALANAGFPEMPIQSKAQWTILVYYGGDSTLETGLMSDLVEFERAGGSTENTRIIALLDRYGLSDANGGWTGARLYEVTQNTTGDFGAVPVPTIDSVALADLGDTDTGSGETLARFMTWGIQHYPADQYALAFGGHGGGWRGVITDDTTRSIITLPQLDEAMRVVKQATGIGQFDLLINDACLMSSVEYYDIMARYFDYSLASPEIVIDPALDMTLLTELIQGNITLDEIGSPLVNTYIERDILLRERPDSRYMTFASTQMDEMADVRRATEAFARLVNSDPLAYAPLLGQARINTYTYAKFLGSDNDYDVDLGHFMRQIIAYSADAPIISAAREVLRALEDARLYGSAADYARLYTSYYSIYFPRRSKDFDSRYFNDTPLKQWAEMLANYYNSTMPRLWAMEDSILTYHPPIRPEVSITTAYPEIANAQNPPVVGLQVVGRGLSQGQFTVDQLTESGEKIRLMSTPILTELTVGRQTEFLNTWKSGLDLSYFNWQPFNLPVVTDGVVAHNELLVKTADLATLAGRFRIPDTERWVEVAVVFNPLGYVEQVVARSDSLGVVAPITIPTGAEFVAYRYVVMSDGDVKPEAGNSYTWGENGIAFVDSDVPAGNYEMGFLVKTFSGISGFASTPITITTSDAGREEFVGYTDLELGINYQHPATWQSVTDLQDILYTVAPNDNTEMLVYSIPMTGNTYEILDVFTRAYNARLFAPATSLSLFDTPALQFDVTWAERPGWRGRGVVVYKETAQGDMGVVFIVNGTDTNTITSTFVGMRDSIRLFDSPPNLSSWHYDKFPNGLAYPVPTTWGRTDDGDWRVYTDSASPNTTVAIARLRADSPQTLLNDLVAQYAPSAGDVQIRAYFSEYRTWQVAGFTQEVNGEQLAGRIYTASIDSRVYAIRVQTPLGEASAQAYRTIFEPLVDGFAPRLTVILSSGGVLSTYTKAALTQSQATCADMPFNTVCVGEGTVNITYAETDINAKRIDSAQAVVNPFDGLQAVDVGLLDNSTIDPFSVALFNIQANLPNKATGGLVMAVFGGVTVENRSTDGAMMNVFDIFLNGAPNDPNLVHGVLLLAPRDMPVMIIINGVEFELAPNAVMFWREASDDIESTSTEGDRVGVVGLVAKRRPGSWSSEVLKGILRARVRGTFADQVATSVAGTSITYDTDLSISQINPNAQTFYNNLISFKPDVFIEPPISDELLDFINANQVLLNEFPLDGELLLDNLSEPDVLSNPNVITDPLSLPDPIPTAEVPIITDIPPVGTPEVPPPSIYGLTVPDLSCVEGQQLNHSATYTSNEGATLVSVTPVAGAVSMSVETIVNNVASLNVICPEYSDGYTASLNGVDSLGRSVSVTFNVDVSFAPPIFTVYDTTCQQGQLTNIVGNLSGSDIDPMVSPIIAIVDPNIATQINPPVINFGDVTIPIQCLMTGNTAVTVTVTDLDTSVYVDSATIFVSPNSPVGSLSANDDSCFEGSSALVTVTYTNIAFPAYQMNSITTLESSNPAGANIVGNSFSPPSNSFNVQINCYLDSTITISIVVVDTNGDTYNYDAIIDVQAIAPPYFSGGTSHTCTVGQQYFMQFEYLENEPGTPTLTGASAGAGGAVSVQAGNINLINSNTWVTLLVDCDFVGGGTVDVFATTTSGLYPNVDVTGINFTVAP